MAKLVITTKTCPCCGYKYQVSKTFKDQKRVVKRIVQKNQKDDHIIPYDYCTFFYAQDYFSKYGIIPSYAKSKCEILTEEITEEVFEKDEITIGDIDFKKIKFPSNSHLKLGGPPSVDNYFGMFCPKCGVFLNINICTKTEEKNL